MKTIRILLPALLLALAANPAQAQSKDKIDKARGTGETMRPADPANEARRQKDAEQRAHAERFPPAPLRALPPAPLKPSSSSDKGK